MIKFLKNWTLPIAMIAGVLSYFIYVSIPALDSTHQLANDFISIIQPGLLFCMLFVSFCKVSPRQLRPRLWMIKPLAVQVLSFVLLAIPIIICNDIPGRAIIESMMACMICPTATAASVVTAKLHGNASTVVSYTFLINIAVALLVPAVIPLLHEPQHADMDFLQSFYIIMAKIFPLLILPLVSAWAVRYLLPHLHAKLLTCTNLAFYLWAVALALAIAVTVKAIVHTDQSIFTLIGIAIASAITCVIQFYIGRKIGIKHGDKIAGAQSLGQKNTVFAIWMCYTFMNPVTAMAGGFYSVWHNAVNSYQLWKARKEETIN